MATKKFNVFNLNWSVPSEQYISPTPLHSFVSVLSAAIILEIDIDRMLSSPGNFGEFLFWASQSTTWKIETDATNDVSYSTK